MLFPRILPLVMCGTVKKEPRRQESARLLLFCCHSAGVQGHLNTVEVAAAVVHPQVIVTRYRYTGLIDRTVCDDGIFQIDGNGKVIHRDRLH